MAEEDYSSGPWHISDATMQLHGMQQERLQREEDERERKAKNVQLLKSMLRLGEMTSKEWNTKTQEILEMKVDQPVIDPDTGKAVMVDGKPLTRKVPMYELDPEYVKSNILSRWITPPGGRTRLSSTGQNIKDTTPGGQYLDVRGPENILEIAKSGKEFLVGKYGEPAPWMPKLNMRPPGDAPPKYREPVADEVEDPAFQEIEVGPVSGFGDFDVWDSPPPIDRNLRQEGVPDALKVENRPEVNIPKSGGVDSSYYEPSKEVYQEDLYSTTPNYGSRSEPIDDQVSFDPQQDTQESGSVDYATQIVQADIAEEAVNEEAKAWGGGVDTSPGQGSDIYPTEAVGTAWKAYDTASNWDEMSTTEKTLGVAETALNVSNLFSDDVASRVGDPILDYFWD